MSTLDNEDGYLHVKYHFRGYGCGDHFLEPDTFLHSWEVLAEIIKHPNSSGILLDLGM